MYIGAVAVLPTYVRFYFYPSLSVSIPVRLRLRLFQLQLARAVRVESRVGPCRLEPKALVVRLCAVCHSDRTGLSTSLTGQSGE